MTNRYCNLNGNLNISDTYTNITTGFTAVQTDIDANDADITSLQQQITAEQQARIAADTAHANSTTAHSADHITYNGSVTGQTTAKGAIDKLKTDMNAIISTPNDGNAEITVARQSLDGSAPTTLGDRLDKMEAKQLAAAIQEATITHGWNYVLSDTDSPLNVRVKGVTRVNLLGSDGNFEADSDSDGVANGYTHGTKGSYTLSTVGVEYGTKAQRITGLSDDPTIGDRYLTKNVSLKAGKKYIFAVDVATDGSALARTEIYDLTNSTSLLDSQSTNASQFVYIKLSPSNDISANINLYNYSAVGSTGWAQFDGARVFEISASDYAAIDTMTADQVAAKYPYCDSVQHLKNPILTASGKNLLPPFSEWTLHANAVVTEPYKLTLNATGASQLSSVTLDALPSTQYTMSIQSMTGDRFFYSAKNASGTELFFDFITASGSKTFTTPAGTTTLNIGVYDSVGSGTFTFTEPMLELGSTATPFVEASPKYMYVLTTLAGNPITGVYDTFDSASKTVTRRFETGDLSGDQSWAFTSDFTGFKRVSLANYFTGAVLRQVTGDDASMVKYDGSLMTTYADNGNTFDQADLFALDGRDNGLDVTVDDDDSGWGEDYTPSSAEIKAYFYGWKLNNGTFGTAYNGTGTKTWTRWDATDNTGAVTTVPTTLASGYPGYELSYQLAVSTVESVQVEGSLDVVEGGNQISLGEGVFPRVKVTPVLSSGNYIINLAAVPSSCPANRVDKIIQIDRGLDKDNKWVITNNVDAYGNQRAQIAGVDYDDTKEYYLTFIALDKYSMTANATDAEVTYQTSDHSVLGQVVQKQADIETNVTININAIAELYKRVIALGG